MRVVYIRIFKKCLKNNFLLDFETWFFWHTILLSLPNESMCLCD